VMASISSKPGARKTRALMVGLVSRKDAKNAKGKGRFRAED
jgi:hypothetical protein